MNLIQRWNQIWQEQADKRNRIKMILDGGEMIFYFTHKGQLYGAGEPSRVTFAQMKDPDEGKEWRQDASFPAMDLHKCVAGEQNQNIFGGKELDDIKVITDRDKVEKMLLKGSEDD